MAVYYFKGNSKHFYLGFKNHILGAEEIAVCKVLAMQAQRLE